MILEIHIIPEQVSLNYLLVGISVEDLQIPKSVVNMHVDPNIAIQNYLLSQFMTLFEFA